MSLSTSEHKIKNALGKREITPSITLWDDIQQELDNEAKPIKSFRYLKIASIAAVLLLSFLAYTNYNSSSKYNPTLVTDVKPIEKNSIQLKPKLLSTPVVNITYPNVLIINTKEENTAKVMPYNNKSSNSNVLSESKFTSTNISTANENLIVEVAQNNLNEANKETLLLAEVNRLLDNAINSADDDDKKQMFKNYKAELLLAEVEGELDREEPIKFKEKVWEAIVSNFNDIKSGIVSN